MNEGDFSAEDSVLKWEDDMTEGAVETSDAFEPMEGEEQENTPEPAEDDELSMKLNRMLDESDEGSMYTGAVSDDADPDFI